MKNEIVDCHDTLTQRFRHIAETRKDYPVFLLEHGMSPEELRELRESLRKAFRLNDGAIEDIFGSCYLPFLVIATETGYDYIGNEGGFWPKFEADICCGNLTHGKRQTVSAWYRRASRLFRIIPPPDTTWAQQFCHIAWPITNSVLPKDIRWQLLESLRSIPSHYYFDSEPEKLAEKLGEYSDQKHRRYAHWLKGPTVGQLIQALLSDDPLSEKSDVDFLTAETLERLRSDMEKDKDIIVQLKGLKERIKREQLSFSRVASTLPSPYRSKPISRTGRLFLLCDENGKWMLEGQLPESVVIELREYGELRKMLRSAIWRPKAWNNLSLKPDVFLSQGRFGIPSSYWSEINDTPFLDLTGIFDDEIGMSELLRSIRFRFVLPAFFEALPQDEDSKTGEFRRVSEIVSGTESILYIRKAGPGIENVEGITVDNNPPVGCQVFHIDTKSAAALAWAKSRGLRVKERQVLKWIVPFGRTDENERRLSVVEGTSFFLDVDADQPVHVALNEESVEIQTGLIAFDSSPPGDYEIEVDSETIGETWQLNVAEKRSVLFYPQLQGEPDVDSLRKRALSTSVESLQPFVNLRYTLSLFRVGGESEKVSCSGMLETTPGTLPRKAFFADAFDENDSEIKNRFWSLVGGEQDLKLVLDIESVYRHEWLLESTNPGIWWEQTDTETPVACCDGEEIATEELLHKPERYPLYPEDCRLFRAVDPQEPIYRAPTVFRHPGILFQDRNFVNVPDRLFRRERDGKTGLGIGAILDDILAFRQVRTEGLLSELARKRILKALQTVFWKICCGEQWVKKTEKFDEIDFAVLLASRLKELVRNKMQWSWRTETIVPDPDGSERIVGKNHDRKGISPKILSDDILSDMLAEQRAVENVIRLYPDLGRSFRHDIDFPLRIKLIGLLSLPLKPMLEQKAGHPVSVDIEGKDWNSCFDDFTDTIHGRELAGLLYPLSFGDELFESFQDELSLEETAECFEKIQKPLLTRSPYRNLWNTGVVKNLFSIFMKPGAFEPHWKQETLRALLLDRQSMLGIAFVCHRFQQREKINDFFGN